MRFTIDAEPFGGQVYDYIGQDDVTWTEAEDIERLLGHSLTEFNDPQRGEALRGTSRPTAVFIYNSIRRVRPQTTFEEVAATPRGALRVLPDSPDPTDDDSASEPTIETTDDGTSPPSPSTLESGRGSGDT